MFSIELTWTGPFWKICVNHSNMKVQSGDRLLTQWTHCPDPKMNRLTMTVNRLLVVK